MKGKDLSAALRMAGLGLALAALTFCARRVSPLTAPEPGRAETALASWYGPGFDGRLTSNREIYDMNAMTAAHKTLPFGSIVRVTNLGNGKACIVRINDRGPFIEGRDIDLSRAAARSLGMIGPGTARVRLEILSARGSLPPVRYAVQVGSFASAELARRLEARLRTRFDGLYVSPCVVDDRPMYRVRVRGADREACEKMAERLGREGFAALIVEDGGSSGRSALRLPQESPFP